LTPTKVRGRSVIRVQVGQFDCTAEDVAMIERVVADLLPRA
jgi:aromatic-L-amino-acid decarboxylase